MNVSNIATTSWGGDIQDVLSNKLVRPVGQSRQIDVLAPSASLKVADGLRVDVRSHGVQVRVRGSQVGHLQGDGGLGVGDAGRVDDTEHALLAKKTSDIYDSYPSMATYQ